MSREEGSYAEEEHPGQMGQQLWNGDGIENTGLKSHHGKKESHLSRMHRELPRVAEIKAQEKDNGLRETGLC